MTNDPHSLPALQNELQSLSARHSTLDHALRSPASQAWAPEVRAAARHQLRGYDDTLYWLRMRVRALGGAT